MQGTGEEEFDEEGHRGHNHSHELDLYVRLDPVSAQRGMIAIRDAFIKECPGRRAVFGRSTIAYLGKLTALDKEYRAAFADAKNRTFVAQYAILGYSAGQYDLTQELIAGISPDQEPSPSRLAELKKYIKTSNVSMIYFEASAFTKVAKTLIDETNVELAVLNPLESLIQKEQEVGENYMSIMRENLTILQKNIY